LLCDVGFRVCLQLLLLFLLHYGFILFVYLLLWSMMMSIALGGVFYHVPEEKTNIEVGRAARPQSNSTVGGKRKRGNFTKDEMLLLTNMSDAVNNVANELREIGATHVDPDLYLAVMEM